MKEEEVDSSEKAREVAAQVIPRPSYGNPFFADAARALSREVLVSFIRSRQPWTFRDVAIVLSSKERLREVLERAPEARGLLVSLLKNDETFTEIMAVLNTHWQRYNTTGS